MTTTFETVMFSTLQDHIFMHGEFGYNWTHGFVKENTHGENKTNHDTFIQMRSKVEGYQKTENRNNSVIFLGMPCVNKTFDIKKPDNRHHDNRSKSCLWEMIEKGGEKEQGNNNHDGRYDRRHTGNCTSCQVYSRTGERTGNRIT